MPTTTFAGPPMADLATDGRIRPLPSIFPRLTMRGVAIGGGFGRPKFRSPRPPPALAGSPVPPGAAGVCTAGPKRSPPLGILIFSCVATGSPIALRATGADDSGRRVRKLSGFVILKLGFTSRPLSGVLPKRGDTAVTPISVGPFGPVRAALMPLAVPPCRAEAPLALEW